MAEAESPAPITRARLRTSRERGAGPGPRVTAGDPAALGLFEPVTLVHGPAYCLTGRAGDVHPGSGDGLYVREQRVLSELQLRIDGAAVRPLAVYRSEPARVVHVGHMPGLPGHGTLLVVRERTLAERGAVLQEDVQLHHHGERVLTVTVELIVAADFAEVSAVRENRERPEGEHRRRVDADGLELGWRLGEADRRVRLRFSEGGRHVAAGGCTWTVEVHPGEVARRSWTLDVAFGDRWIGDGEPAPDTGRAPSWALGPDGDRRRADEDRERWLADAPTVHTDHAPLAWAVQRAIHELAGLRLVDQRGGRRPIIGAGNPWSRTLVARDALVAAYTALPVDPTLALGVLEALAELQGEDLDPRTQEEPGRILHKIRFATPGTGGMDGTDTTYGSVDATPLFVIVLGTLAGWGLPEEDLALLVPHADRALAWIEDFGDLDGDGFVEYRLSTGRDDAHHGVHPATHQGWKDSADAVRHADGSLARGPIALAEVQGHVHHTYLARALVARRLGEEGFEERYLRKAAQLRTAFRDAFWFEDEGIVAMALDRDKRPVTTATSNMGRCLTSGLLTAEDAARVAERLLRDDLFNGWGIRTTARGEVSFDPLSYHRGSVWPADTALIAAGLMRYGHVEAAQRLVVALLEASAVFGGRLPEPISGIDRGAVPVPVPVPRAATLQAPAAGTSLLLLRTLLQLDPYVPLGEVRLDPRLPDAIGSLEVRGLRLWDRRLTVRVDEAGVDVVGLGGLSWVLGNPTWLLGSGEAVPPSGPG